MHRYHYYTLKRKKKKTRFEALSFQKIFHFCISKAFKIRRINSHLMDNPNILLWFNKVNLSIFHNLFLRWTKYTLQRIHFNTSFSITFIYEQYFHRLETFSFLLYSLGQWKEEHHKLNRYFGRSKALWTKLNKKNINSCWAD